MIFNLVHGNNLVYNTCWYDPRVDKEALNLSKDDAVLTITSAGCNALSYALEDVARVYAVDMNYRQNALLDLKIAGVKKLDYETFFQLFGEGRLPGVQKLYRDKLRELLPEPSQAYWDRYIKRFFDSEDRTFYYRGSTGYFARFILKYLKRRGLLPQIDALLDAPDLEAQRAAWRALREKLWSRGFKFIVNSRLSTTFLCVPRDQRRLIEESFGKISSFFEEALDEVFGELPIQDNYLWRVYAKGRHSRDCCPDYLTRAGFEKLKSGAIDAVSTHTNTVEGFLRAERPKISRFSLLDHMDWLSGRRFDALVAEWSAILDAATENARAIWYGAGRDATSFLNRVRVVRDGRERGLSEILRYDVDLARELRRRCRAHTYGSFYVADIRL